MRTVDLDPDGEEVHSIFTVEEMDVALDADDEVTVTTVTDEEPWDEEVEVIVVLAAGMVGRREEGEGDCEEVMEGTNKK